MHLFFKIANALRNRGFWRFPVFRLLYKQIYKSVRSNLTGTLLITTYEGIKLHANIGEMGLVHSILRKGCHERQMTQLFKGFIKPGMVVVDVGANVGYYSMIASRLVGKTGKVYAFEPEPGNFKLLVRNVRANHCRNIIPVQKAVSNKEGKMKLFVDKANMGAHSLSENNVPEKTGFAEVETITLDSFFRDVVKNDKVDVIKIDAQGSEGAIVEGAARLLRNNNPKIFMEFWPYGLRNMGTDPRELLCRLKDSGFKIGLIDEQGLCIRRTKLNETVRICENIGDSEYYTNLLLER